MKFHAVFLRFQAAMLFSYRIAFFENFFSIEKFELKIFVLKFEVLAFYGLLIARAVFDHNRVNTISYFILRATPIAERRKKICKYRFCKTMPTRCWPLYGHERLSASIGARSYCTGSWLASGTV